MKWLQFETKEKVSNAGFFKGIQKFVESFEVMCVFHQAFLDVDKKEHGSQYARLPSNSRWRNFLN